MTDFHTRFGPEVQNEMSQLLDHLRQQAMTGQYIYRGEPKLYRKVMSSLYRQCEKKGFAPKVLPETLAWCEQMWELQKDIVVQTRRFLPGHQKLDMYERQFWGRDHYSLSKHIDTKEYEILCQLQHYGGATNLVDFTNDYLIALFFACEQKPGKCGRVILSRAIPLPVRISDARVQAQKAVFVQVPDGFMNPEHFSQITVPAKLKLPLLLYLKQYHAISSENLFPDIQGAVKYWHDNQSFLFWIREAEQKSKDGEYAKAVEIYDKCLSLSLEEDPRVLIDRGVAKFNLNLWKPSCDDLDRAISLYDQDWKWTGYSGWGFALFMRGMTFIQREQWAEAIQNLNTAKDKGYKVATEFHKHFGDITAFEDEYGLSLPDNIKEVLTNCEVEGQT